MSVVMPPFPFTACFPSGFRVDVVATRLAAYPPRAAIPETLNEDVSTATRRHNDLALQVFGLIIHCYLSAKLVPYFHLADSNTSTDLLLLS